MAFAKNNKLWVQIIPGQASTNGANWSADGPSRVACAKLQRELAFVGHFLCFVSLGKQRNEEKDAFYVKTKESVNLSTTYDFFIKKKESEKYLVSIK